MEYINQHQMVIDYIKLNGSITVSDAQKDLGIAYLPPRISELRKAGYPILSKTEHGKNRFGKAVTYTRYYLDGENNDG